jgi:hypothetical protein
MLERTLVALLLTLTQTGVSAQPTLEERFRALQGEIQEALPRGGVAPRPLARAQRRHITELRKALAEEMPRQDLTDARWVDLHVMLQALDRRLDHPPPRHRDRRRPVGPERYLWLLRHRHQLDLDLRDLQLLGEHVWYRTLAELEHEASLIEPGTSWQELCRRAMEDHPSAREEVLPLCRELALAAWRHTEASGWVTVPGRAVELGCAWGPADVNRPYAWYQPGQLRADGVYEGTLMVTPLPADASPAGRDRLLRDVNRHWMQVVALHEGIPGHHLQYAVASTGSSPVRGWAYTPTHVEGWALYVEEQMHRAGFYRSPLTRLTQLRMRLWRAARLRLDPALHTGGLSPEAAIELLEREVLLAPANAAREVDRYLRRPTYPSSYVLGWLQLEALRREAQARAGATWDERAFHDAFLALGPVPVSLARAVLLGEREAYDRTHP